jgi:hypothetical protein
MNGQGAKKQELTPESVGTHVPISLAVLQRKKLDLEGWIWNSVLAITGQPRHTL